MLEMMRTWLYNSVLFLLFICYLPQYLWGRLIHKKYKRSFWYRLGLKKSKLPHDTKAPVIWIHAVSFGETKAAFSFTQEARAAYPEATLVFSSITETGFDEVKRSMPFIDAHFFLPFDFSWIVKPLVKKIKPDLVVFVEGDLWPNFLNAAQIVGAKTLLINGKISEKSLRRYLLFKNYTCHLFSQLTHCCAQNTLYAKRFEKLGVSALSVTGNIKLDAPLDSLTADQKQQLKKRLGIVPEDFVLTIGSTHEKEEELLLNALESLLKQEKRLKILIAPRHPERFKKVAQALSKQLPCTTWSDISSNQKEHSLILIDTLGQLRNCYQISDVAIVAGSFVDIGGHNILEPSEYGVPTIFGPYVYNQIEFAQIALHEQIGFQLTLEELSKNICSLLNNIELRDAIKERALAFFAQSKGASLKSWRKAKELISH